MLLGYRKGLGAYIIIITTIFHHRADEISNQRSEASLFNTLELLTKA